MSTIPGVCCDIVWAQSQSDHGEESTSSVPKGDERWLFCSRELGRLLLLVLFNFKVPDDSSVCQLFNLGGCYQIISTLVSLTVKDPEE